MNADTTDPASDLETLHAVTAAAADVLGAPARRHAATIYLRQRGIDARGLRNDWFLGYAPPGWTRLVDKLSDRFDEQALIDAGVAARSSRGTLIDVFRDRVILGVRAADSTLTGFVGRDLSGDANAPRYLNTRRTALFDKGALLYGLSEGGTIGRQPVVVEGPLDAIAIAARAAHDGTPLLPLAACGTAFTAAHARAVASAAFRHHAPVVVAMDADAPGRASALIVGEQLRRTGLDVRLAALPNGTDPATYLARPDARLDTFSHDNATPLVAARLQALIAQQGDSMQWIEGRLGALRGIAGYLTTYPASYAGEQIRWIADTLDLQPSTVTRELAGAFGAVDADHRVASPVDRQHVAI